MSMLILANFLTGALATVFVIVAVLMILVVLIQKPKGGGLSGAFGAGGGGTDQAMFGAKVGDVLTYITVGFFVAFLGLGIGLVYATRAESAAAKLGVDKAQTIEAGEDAGAGATGDDPTATDDIEVDDDEVPVGPAIPAGSPETE